MKAIIDNKLYDTETAKLLFQYHHKNYVLLIEKTYFWFWEHADIYITKNKNYFIHFYNDKGYDYKNRIEKASEDQIKEIILELDPDKYQELYGKLEEA